MAFDPDAYLAKPFDPDAYLNAAPAASPPAAPAAPPPKWTDVLATAPARGIAALGDVLVNLPAHAANVAYMPYKEMYSAMGADLPSYIPTPPMVTQAFQSFGAAPELANMTPAQRVADVAIQSAVPMGAPARGSALIRNALLGMGGGAVAQGVTETTGSPGMGLAAALAPAGAAAGARAAGRAAGQMANQLSPDYQAQQLLRRSLGDDPRAIAQVQEANRLAAQQGITPAMAAASTGRTLPGYQSLLRTFGEMDPLGAGLQAETDLYNRQLRDLQRMAGGATQTEARATRESTKQTLGRLTEPMREGALEGPRAAAAAGRGARTEAEQLMFADALQIAEQKVGAISGNDLTSRVRGIADRPGVRVDRTQNQVLSNVADLIEQETARGGGFISPDALYGIRKSAVNAEVQRLMPTADAKAQKKYAAELLGKLRPIIDDAITQAGGVGWRDYLQTFEQGSRQVDQQKLLARLMELRQKSPEQFLSVVRGNDMRPVEKTFGPGKFDIELALGDNYAPLKTMADEMELMSTAREQSARGGAALTQQIREGQPILARLPHLFSAKVTLANEAIRNLEGQVSSKTSKLLIDAVSSGEDINKLLAKIPAGERNKVARALKNAGVPFPTVAGPAAPLLNQMAPEQERRNALAP